MKLNTRLIIMRAIEAGVASGINRAFKYSNAPTREALMEEVANATTLEIDDILIDESTNGGE